MARTKPLTLSQAKQKAYERRSAALARGLGAAKSFDRMDNKDMAEQLGLCSPTVSRLLKGENVCLPVMTFWKALDMAGLEVRPKPANLEL